MYSPVQKIEDECQNELRITAYAKIAKSALIDKSELIIIMSKISDTLFWRYSLSKNERLSKGVRKLILKNK